jgi:hypothetical protein
MLQVNTTVPTLCLMVTQTQEYMETGAADAHAFLGK